ncbi:hypothetical protein WA158_005284 [Blastocystis sp. Blastoise]
MVDDFIMTIDDSDIDDENQETTLNTEVDSDPDNIMKESEDLNKEFVFGQDENQAQTKWEIEGNNQTEKAKAQSKMAFLESQIEQKRNERESKNKEEESSEDEEEDIGEDLIRNIHEEPVSVNTDKQDKNQKNFFEEENKSIEVIKTFNGLHLSRPLLKAVNELGFLNPTPIQARTIPLALSGKDICAAAKTGSGKTAAYLLPCLERLLYRERKEACIRVLIVTPTRELASQVYSMFTKLAKFTDITGCLVVGGLSLQNQATDLRKRPDIVICTPGRMLDHIRNSMSVSIDDLDVLILDEADRLLDLGFKEEINELVASCPKSRQTLLFSATMTDSVSDLISLSLNKPSRIFVDPVNLVVDRLIQEFIRVKKIDYLDGMLLSLVTKSFTSETIIFCDKKREAHRYHVIFGLLGLKSVELHGDLTQKVLIFKCKDRRTARAGRGGRAITFVEEDDRLIMKQIVKKAIENKQTIKSRVISNKAIEKWSKKVADLHQDLKDIYKAERAEKEIDIAEMETTRAQNMLKHSDEIISRPKRTWFQSEKQKKEAKQKDLDFKNKRSKRE